MKLMLHLGAHRTGTTALQQTCQVHAKHLAMKGVVIWGPKRMRTPGVSNYFTLFGRQKTNPVAAGQMELQRKDFRTAIRHQAVKGIKRLVISEENMIGEMAANLDSGMLYPRAKLRLSSYLDLFGQHPDEILLSLRDYVGFWGSCHRFVSQHREVKRIDKITPAILGDGRGWVDLVLDIRRACPEATIWLALHRLAPGYLSTQMTLLLGEAAEALVTKDRAPDNASTSLGNGPGAGTTRNLFSPCEVRQLTHRFRQDVEQLFQGGVENTHFLGSGQALGGDGERYG